jgi:hypothetical protein
MLLRYELDLRGCIGFEICMIVCMAKMQRNLVVIEMTRH